jgi:hypothetical protein
MALIKTLRLRERATKLGPKHGEKAIEDPRFMRDDRVNRYCGGPAWNPQAKREQYNPEFNTIYTTPYVLNTKYVVDCEQHPLIGCVVTLTTGGTVHVDVDIHQLTQAGNQR